MIEKFFALLARRSFNRGGAINYLALLQKEKSLTPMRVVRPETLERIKM